MLTDLPILTEKQVQDHISEGYIHFKRGHISQVHKNTKSTRNKQSNTKEDELTQFCGNGTQKTSQLINKYLKMSDL